MTFCDAEGWTVFSQSRTMDFTLCFQDSILTLIPNVILLVFFSPRLHKVIGKGHLEGVKATTSFYVKMLLVLASWAIQLVILIEIVAENNYRSSSLLSTIVYLVGLTGAAALHWFEYFNMANTSAGLLVFWIFTALISIFPTRSWIQTSSDGLSSPLPLLKLLFTIVSFLVFIVENIPKPHRASLTHPNVEVIEQQNPSPETRANYFTRVTFFWLLPLLRLGKKKTLRMDDLWSLHPKFLSYPLYLTTKAKIDADEAITLQRIKAEGEKGVSREESKVKKGKINLFETILYTVGYSFLSAVFPRLLYIAAFYVRPILIKNLIGFVNTYSEAAGVQGVKPEEPWVGFGLTIAVFASAIFSTLFDGQFQFICSTASLKARGVLVNLIYRKALRLSSTNKQEGMGSIVNHMSTDIDKVMVFFNVTHYIWSGTIEIVITMVLLYSEVRYAMFASIGVIIVIALISVVVSPKISSSQKQMMKLSDHRMKLITELVNYIKSIKLYAWESYFAGKISKVRVEQLDYLRIFYGWVTIISVFMNSIVPFCIFATLTVYAAIATEDAPLNTQRIFTTIVLINMLGDPIGMLQNSMSSIFSGKVAYDRLRDFLNSEEVDDENVLHNLDATSSEVAYEVIDGTFGWYTPEAIRASIEKKEKEDNAKPEADSKAVKKNKTTKKIEESEKSEKMASEISDEKKDRPEPTRDSMGPVLHNINLSIKRGSLTLVVGRVGEGKSSLVGALLGEMHKYSGTVRSFGSLAYVSQSAWILNDTVRNNILFGQPYNKERYLDTIRACALVPDFKMLVNSDKTVIGEKGINLSGGQKQRISIARAVYANADVYIFDDPLSAVDAHVDEHIFNHALTSILAEKTRILITNGVNHLKDADQIIVLKQGRISQDGQYDDLIQNEQGDLFRLIQESKLVASKATKGEDEEETSATGSDEDEEDSITEDDRDEAVMDDKSKDIQKRPTIKRAKSSKIKEDHIELDERDEVDDEVVAQGNIGWSVYSYYLSTLGVFSICSLVLASVGFMGIQVGTQLWMGRWGKENDMATAESQNAGYTIEPEHTSRYWITTYFGWVLVSSIMLAILITTSIIFMARKASKKLHYAMLLPMIRSPMSFFDVTSSGKIVNRFSHDINSVDIELPLGFLNLMFISLMALNTFGMCVAASPYFVIIMIPLAFGYYQLGGFFLVSNRELKRLDSAARSPLYGHFGETLSGLVTIRAFSDSDRFAIQATAMLDRSQQTSYLINATARWLQIMLDLLSVIVLTSVAVLAILQRNSVNQQIFSIVLSNIGSLTIIMSRMLSISCQLETTIVSVERVREYIQLTPEARDIIPDSKTDEAWPQHGQITFNQYSTRYRDGLDLVLKDVSVTIKGGERIGIVGRTGAGKSSVTMALFRIIEAAKGSIVIDGVDISTLGLHELRSRLTIIPQDPFLFGESIRVNLDPLNKYNDAEIWAALESASLKSYVQTLPETLSTTIENGGENMSLGQRQLMSLARAMLTKNTRVLCLDEATAAIDVETDNAIQRALRREFSGCTVLTIAHRINTIMDSDRILVLEKGRVAEYDSPQNLLQNKDSVFYSLAAKSGNA
ncbi:hypothetical protein BGX21_006879 [Mortierella sp. AD011]|nr:hypothetical protein BGX20_007056 [Mortierella sp. AD010]KAF9399043.1 hypothetical protein BGX21_006879 [Mortierella sp. AD011]